MGKNIWLISDTHFNHENILKFEDENGEKFRGKLFNNLNEMNELMIENWNKNIKQGDKVYHLGDVFMKNISLYIPIHQRLNSHNNIRLILGNHDDPIPMVQNKLFKKIYMWRIFREFGITLTHVPIHESSFRHRTKLNVFGHIHQNKAPNGPYKCVCVEHTNYSPIHIEDVIQGI